MRANEGAADAALSKFQKSNRPHGGLLQFHALALNRIPCYFLTTMAKVLIRPQPGSTEHVARSQEKKAHRAPGD